MKSLIFLLFSLGTCASNNPGPVCPSMPVSPHAEIKFNKPLPAATYDVEVTLDTQTEKCAMTIGPSSPAVEMGAVVQGPMTKTETTCKLLRFAHVRTDGGVDDLEMMKPTGKSEVAFSLKMSVGGVAVVEGATTLKFVPTDTLGPGCGRTDVAAVTLSLK